MHQRFELPPTIRHAARVALIVVAMASIASAMWYLYDQSAILKGSGGYDLTLHIDVHAPLRSVRAYACFRRDMAETLRDSLQDCDLTSPDGQADPFIGAPLKVRIDTWSNTTRSGREISAGHEEWLMVLAELENGGRIAQVIAVPDMFVSREARVEMP